ncbi:hypothetical protein D9V75_02830 [Buchnera aphidicola (Muscaphis stroyani)]|uniref:Uncharacterized protein n=1 Tax=Buchnera aphidicola (Muscaphis stroyani) TaxID=1241869 RepID=A0A4D6Y5C5_9GAMM|nr:hypothetical protein [Buchnera aphidicola]QCI24612.1 hypothetical protein D9V75_02830 [Buchnera aphidicola (Muscaphis stroyani)]
MIKAIIEKIRSQGKIKIINTFNNNPQHPESQSSFPDLFVVTPPVKTQDEYYPFNILEEDFNLKGRKNVFKKEKTFQERMDESAKKSRYDHFMNHRIWQVSDRFNTPQNIFSTINYFKKSYEELILSKKLDSDFMADSIPFFIIIDGRLIFLDDKSKMQKIFKEIVPNEDYQVLISTYANDKFLNQPLLQLYSENPELKEYELKNQKNIYKINMLENGSIKLVATYLSNLELKDKNYIKKYSFFGVRSTVIVSPENKPIIKYSYFVQ